MAIVYIAGLAAPLLVCIPYSLGVLGRTVDGN